MCQNQLYIQTCSDGLARKIKGGELIGVILVILIDRSIESIIRSNRILIHGRLNRFAVLIEQDVGSLYAPELRNISTGLDEELTLTDSEGNAVPNMQIGTWKESQFVPMEGVTTDENGKITLNFDETGRLPLITNSPCPFTFTVQTGGIIGQSNSTSEVSGYLL